MVNWQDYADAPPANCGFCDSPAAVELAEDGCSWAVMCGTPNCFVGPDRPTRDDAIFCWNAVMSAANVPKKKKRRGKQGRALYPVREFAKLKEPVRSKSEIGEGPFVQLLTHEASGKT